MTKTDLTKEMIVAYLQRCALHDQRQMVWEAAQALTGNETALRNVARALSMAETRPNRALVITEALRRDLADWMVPGAYQPQADSAWSGGNEVSL